MMMSSEIKVITEITTVSMMTIMTTKMNMVATTMSMATVTTMMSMATVTTTMNMAIMMITMMATMTSTMITKKKKKRTLIGNQIQTKQKKLKLRQSLMAKMLLSSFPPLTLPLIPHCINRPMAVARLAVMKSHRSTQTKLVC